MDFNVTDVPHEFMRPMVSGWVAKLEMAEKSRANWKELANECRMFYNRSAAAMWSPGYAKKFWQGVKPPRFRITLNLAYEYVAVFAPNLLWERPHRSVKPKRAPRIPPELLGEELYQVYAEQAGQQEKTDQAVAWLMEDWLNYTAEEQRGGGLVGHSELATLDALITGRGTQWVRTYKSPGSDRTLTGCFYEPPERLLIDPDFKSLDDAKWIALKHVDPHWVVERRFGLKENALKERASLESGWSYGENFGNPNASMHRVAGATNDLIVWWEIWSKTGIGARMTGMQKSIKEGLDKAVGDYAYLAISSSVPYPLNCSAEQMREANLTTEQVKRKFSWPVPLWADGRWPVSVLDFYPNTDPQDDSAAWPIPPLAPAMGEIKFLNFLIPWLANRIWSSSRDFWAIAGPHFEHYKKHLQEGEDQTLIPTPAQVDDVRKAITVLQQPETRADAWRIVDLVTDLFRRRTGMTDYAYGISDTQSRSAQDSLAKKEAVGARPEYMRKKVVAYQSELAAVEAFYVRWFVSGNDVEPRYGPIVRQLWDQLISSSDVELVVRQMQYSISASSIRRPNRDRDIADFQQAHQYFLAAIEQYAAQSGDYSPVNGLMESWGELHDMDMGPMLIPPPEENPEAEQAEREQRELEKAKMEMELEKAKIELQGKVVDAQVKQATGGVDVQKKQLDLMFDQQSSDQDLAQDQTTHVLDILQQREKHAEAMRQMEALNRIKAKQAKQTNGSSNGS